MKLLFIVDSLGSGGAQRQLVTLAVGLSARGHQVEIFTYYDERHFAHIVEAAGIKVHLHAKPSRYSLRPLLTLRHLLKVGEFDCALAFLETPSVYAELASIGIGQTSLIVSERSSYSAKSLGLRGFFLQEMHRLADWVTVNSFEQQATMTRLFPWMRPKICVIWNGVDTDHFLYEQLPPPKAGVLRIQVLASLARSKNPLGLSKAIAICREKYGLRVEVNWAGRPAVSGDGKAAKDEAVLCLQRSGNDDCWSWSGEIKDVRPLIARCDLVVHPSFTEGLPNAICEAFACGRAVLASDIGDHSRLIDNGANGGLFSPEDPESIAHALFGYAQLSPEARDAMSYSARRFAETELSIDRYLQAYEELFAKVGRSSQRC